MVKEGPNTIDNVFRVLDYNDNIHIYARTILSIKTSLASKFINTKSPNLALERTLEMVAIYTELQSAFIRHVYVF